MLASLFCVYKGHEHVTSARSHLDSIIDKRPLSYSKVQWINKYTGSVSLSSLLGFTLALFFIK